jgi:hypothetical protein
MAAMGLGKGVYYAAAGALCKLLWCCGLNHKLLAFFYP